jgi:hypothetical protein
MKKKLSPIAQSILDSITDIEDLSSFDNFKTFQRETFISKRDLKETFSAHISGGSSALNRAHFELKKLWSNAIARKSLTAPKGKTMALESEKTHSNGKITRTFAPIAKPKATRKPRRKSSAPTRRQIRKLAPKGTSSADIILLQKMIADKLAA